MMQKSKIIIYYNVAIATLAKKGRVNVAYNKLKILESIARSEPAGRHTMDISSDTKLSRITVFRLCKQLEDDIYISRKNKQSEYHITKKVYGYPELTAFSFGIKALKTICHDIPRARERVITSNPDYNTLEAKRDQKVLHDFALRLGVIIEYIIIQALRPKKAFPNREKEGLVDLDLNPIIVNGKQKNDIARNWVENAIKPASILDEFCRLWVVKRGLAVFADKGGAESYRSDRPLPLEIQNQLIAERRKVRKMNVHDPLWSPYEMDEQNFKKLNSAFANAFPDPYEKLERLREDLPAEIESGLEMAREEKERISQLEKEDPNHVKCGGKLVHDISRHKDGNRYNKCTNCGRRFILS